MYLLGPFVEIVEAGSVQEEVVVVVDEPVANAEELVEALLLRPEVAMGAEVPLSEQRGAVAGRLQGLGQGDLFEAPC